MLKKIALASALLYTFGTSNEIPVKNNIEQNILQSIDNSKKYVPQIFNNQDDFFKNLQTTTRLLDKDNVLGKYLEEQKKFDYDTNKNSLELKSFTILYFISEDTSVDLIKDFSYRLSKLKEIDPTIEGLIMTRGLIGGNFDTMAEYVKGLQEKGVTKVDITFHPWAFEHFKLEQVPAFALSYCKKDFRFKTCEHKYLVRGEVSLTNFFEIVSDENTEYKKYFQKLIEAK